MFEHGLVLLKVVAGLDGDQDPRQPCDLPKPASYTSYVSKVAWSMFRTLLTVLLQKFIYKCKCQPRIQGDNIVPVHVLEMEKFEHSRFFSDKRDRDCGLNNVVLFSVKLHYPYILHNIIL